MLSLVIPSWNRFEMVIECFKQVIYDDRIDEIVISEDHSLDGSYQKLIEYFKYEPKVKIFRNETNLGCAFNKRKAVELAQNDFVIIFDSDNVITTQYLDVIFDYSWDENVILQPEYLMPNFDFRDYSGVLLTKENISSYIDLPLLETALNAHNFFVNRANYLINTEDQIDAITSDSILFAYNWLASGKSIYITPNLWYWHTVHNLSHYRLYNAKTPVGLHRINFRQTKTTTMNSFEEWDALVKLLYINNMPKEQVLYMNSIEAEETKLFLNQLGSAGITYDKLGNTDINCFTVQWARYIFHIVDTGYIPKN